MNSGVITAGSEIQEALDALPFYAMLIDADHHILLANKAVSQHLGVDPEHIVGGYCPRVVHGLDGPFPGCPLEEAAKKGQAIERELFDARSGRWMRSGVYPVRQRTQGGPAVFLHLTQDITEEKRTKGQLQRNYHTQGALNSLLRLSLEDVPLEELLRRALDLIVSIPWLALESKGAIFLVEDDPQVLVMKAQMGLAVPLQTTCARVPFGRCLCGRAAASGKIVFADRVDERHENRYEGISAHGHYCVPIMSDGKVIGVINLYLKQGHRREEREEEFLEAVAATLTGVIKRKQAEGQLAEHNRALEQKVRELTALNTLFQQHLSMRFQTEEAYRKLVEGIHKLAEEAAQLIREAQQKEPSASMPEQTST